MKRSPMPRRKHPLAKGKPLAKSGTLRRRVGLQAKKDMHALERTTEHVPRAKAARASTLDRKPVVAESNAARELHFDGPKKTKRKVTGALPADVRDQVKARSGGWCEANWPGVCPPGQHRAQHVHHRILKSQGGPDVEWNLLHLCYVVHQHAHDVDRAGAETRGIIRRRSVR